MNERSLFPNGLVWQRSAAALAATVPALVGGTACNIGGDDDGGFRITRVEFDNASTITLTFSEPVADLGEVNPNDFRLSVGMTRQYTYVYDGVSYTYAYTTYQDVSYPAGIYTYDYGPNRFTFESLAVGASGSQVVLTSTDPLGPNACEWLDSVEDFFEMYTSYYGDDVLWDVGFFLHYASGDVPIENQTGVELAEIGPDWVLTEQAGIYSETYGFTMLKPQLRIPCP